MIRLTCPGCDKKLTVADSNAGKLGQCPICKSRIRIPDGLEIKAGEPAAKMLPTAAPPRPASSESAPKAVAPARPRRREPDPVPEVEEVDEREPAEEYDEPERPRKRRKKRRRRTEVSSLPTILILLGVAGGIYLLLILLSIFSNVGPICLLVVGFILAIFGHGWFIYIARQEDALVALMVRFVPFYSVYFFITRIGETLKPFLLWSAGLVFLVTGFIALEVHNVRQQWNQGPFANRAAVQDFLRAAQEKRAANRDIPAGPRTELLKKEDELTENEPKDKILNESHRKIYNVKFRAGFNYVIDMVSNEIDSFLRLEDADGNILVTDDDGGDGLDARIVFKAERDGMYRIVATSFVPEIGRFTLTVQEIGDAKKDEK